MKNYWLIKSEASCYSVDDLKKDTITSWSGIRNYQARNFMKTMKKGDEAVFYHSSATPSAAVGIAKVVREAHPDLSALNKKDDHYDPKASQQNPIWYMVDVAFVNKFKREVTLDEIKFNPKLAGTSVSRRGNRLSVMPISEAHFKIIKELGSKTDH